MDQLDQPLHEATVYSRFGSGNFLCQNHIQNMDGMCTKLDFAVDSLNDTEQLILSLGDGPCEKTPQSKGNITLLFVCSHCPIAFQPQNTESGCKCSCDSIVNSIHTLQIVLERSFLLKILHGSPFSITVQTTQITNILLPPSKFKRKNQLKQTKRS